MLRTFGKTMGTVRRTANDFKRQFDQALREAEREADLEDTKKHLQAISGMDPFVDPRKDSGGSAGAPTPLAATPSVPAAAAAERAAPEPASAAVVPSTGSNAA